METSDARDSFVTSVPLDAIYPTIPKEEPNYFEIIINANPEIICRYSLDKKIKFVNKTLEKLTGKPTGFYIDKSIYDFGYPVSFIEKFNEGFDRCVLTKRPTETEIHISEGGLKDIYVQMNFIPIFEERNEQKPLMGIFSITRDISRQRKLQIDQAEKIEEQKILSQRIINKANKLQNFAHIVSHNLRSPVASLVGLLDLYDETQAPGEKKEIISMFRKSVERLNETIQDLTEAVKINQNLNVKMEKLYFEETLSHIEEGISINILETQTKITRDFSACNSVVYNKVYLESILLNLITNSIKYRHPDRTPYIRFTSEKTNHGIILKCSDNGLGIDLKAHGDKIFGLHKTFHGNQDARGVGLFITKNQVESLNGRISVESEVGVGTTFIIEFANHEIAKTIV